MRNQVQHTKSIFCCVLVLIALGSDVAYAKEEAKKIQDNSFLIEEAYNQEPGMIQHIQTFQYLKRSRTWGYVFTQEWPVPDQTHQLSYTIPVTHVSAPSHDTGIGDVALNYRYQLILKDPIALAPRFSLLLPTGDYKKALGSGSIGFQANLPMSVELSERWVTHLNLGFTFTPSSREPGGASADTLGFNCGASLIWLASEHLNLMLELSWNSTESVQSYGSTTRTDAFLAVPGVRFALNFESGLQVVPGIGILVGLGPSGGEIGVLSYLSFEHPLF
jgi:hypothetical protein